MSRRKSNIELGIVENYNIEDNAIITEEVPVEEAGTITKGKIAAVGKDSIIIILEGYGYSIKANTAEDWIKAGVEVNIVHMGTPGHRDFKVVEMKSNG